MNVLERGVERDLGLAQVAFDLAQPGDDAVRVGDRQDPLMREHVRMGDRARNIVRQEAPVE